jgi:carboxypeptidase Taq
MLDAWQRANLNAIKKAYDEANCISPAMQREYSMTAGACEFVWRTARKNNDFKQLAPYLDRVFNIVREIAAVRANHFDKKRDKKRYDILLDTYIPGSTSNAVEEICAILKAELPGLIQDIVAKQASEKVIPLTHEISEAT